MIIGAWLAGKKVKQLGGSLADIVLWRALIDTVKQFDKNTQILSNVKRFTYKT